MFGQNWDWRSSKLLILLCGYVIFQQFTPSEPYLVPYLTNNKHFSNDEITTRIFPISVYSMLLFTLLAAPACHGFSYHAVIMIGALGKLSTYMILMFGNTLLSMQFMQVAYALGVVTDTVFSSYLFLLVEENKYQQLTSFTQAASTISFAVAAELSQLIMSENGRLQDLLIISIVMVGLACIISILLPHDQGASDSSDLLNPITEGSMKTTTESVLFYICTCNQDVWQLIRRTWDSTHLQLLSLWWACQLGGSSMVENYGTNLFAAISPQSMYNGHVIAATAGVSCLSALIAIPCSRIAAQAGGLVYVIGSCTIGLLCIMMAWCNNIIIVYVSYICSIGLNRLLSCILYVHCARLLSNKQYAFLFTINTLAAYILQSMLQTIVEILQLSVVDQYYFFGAHFLLLVILLGSALLVMNIRGAL